MPFNVYDHAMHCSASLATAVGVGEHIVPPAQGYEIQGIFGKHVADLDATVVTEQCESNPSVQRVVDRCD